MIKEAGADWFVKKPFDNKRLLDLVTKIIYEDKKDTGSPMMFSADMTPESYLMSMIYAYVDESMKLFPSGLNSKILDGYFKTFVRFFNLPVLVEDSEKVRLEAAKSKYIDVLNEMGFADKLVLREDPDMYIFQVIGCKYAENYHHCIKSSSFLCPFAMFVGAFIHSYMNPRIYISRTVLRKGAP